MKDVALVLLRNVITYPMHVANGFKFHTSDHGVGRLTVNSGACIKSSTYSELSSNYYGTV